KKMFSEKSKSFRFGPVSYSFHRHYKENTYLKNRLLRERTSALTGLYSKDLKGHFGCVNAIEFSNHGGELICSGGDDRRVLLWHSESALSRHKAKVMKGEHHSNIFCIAFNNDNTNVFSGGNDEQVIVHDATTGETKDVFLHEEAVYGLSADPNNSSVFASACDDGRILVYDIREPPSSEPFCLANYVSPMHSVMYNPVEPRLLATANSKEGLGLWDIRKPRSCVIKYGGRDCAQSCMSVRINQLGTELVALRRRLPPVLYNLTSETPIHTFDQSGYYNSCTMKSCCFAGDRDQYVVSGSDDFNLYVWKIPEKPNSIKEVDQAHFVLAGHRSIVNQVRFNPDNHLLISSGVEKVIKVWSPFPLPGTLNEETLLNRVEERSMYSHEEYINLVLRSGEVMSHDYTDGSMEEDPRMMAFFDSLVQRELEGWSSSDVSSDTDVDDITAIQQIRDELSQGTATGSDSDAGRISPFSAAFASVMAGRTQQLSNDVINRIDQSEAERSRTPQTENNIVARRARIAELIAKKRREYKEKQASSKTIKKLKTKRKRYTNTIVSSESSDSESDSSAVLKRKPPKQVCKVTIGSGDIVDTSSSSESGDNASIDILEQMQADTRQKKSIMSHIKQMRSRLRNLDSNELCNLGYEALRSESSSSETAPNESSTPIEVESLDLESIHQEIEIPIKLDTTDNMIGPQLPKNDILNKDKMIGPQLPHTSKDSAVPNIETNEMLTPGSTHTSSNIGFTAIKSRAIKRTTIPRSETSRNQIKLNANKNSKHIGNSEHQNTSTEICYTSDNSKSTIENNTKTVDFNHWKTDEESRGNKKDSNSAGSSMTAASNNVQSVWSEFKRFSRRVERARRHYRRISQEDQEQDQNPAD
ncbi:unnamed protein product, partial [Owenia fusiformis]